LDSPLVIETFAVASHRARCGIDGGPERRLLSKPANFSAFILSVLHVVIG
jgi:hypothetical protein